MRRFLVVFLAVVASFPVVGHPAFADDDGGGGGGNGGRNNYVQVFNHKDGAWRTRANADVAHDPGPTVENENVAWAQSSCTDCRTVAVAVQVLLLEGDVTEFRPANAAVAINDTCTGCQTFAFARQEVLTADGSVWLSKDARNQIGQIEDAMQNVAASSEPFVQMSADLDGLTDQLVSVLQDEIARAGTSSHRDSRRQVDERDD